MELIIALQETFGTILVLLLGCTWLGNQLDITEFAPPTWAAWTYTLTLVFSIFVIFVTTIARIWM